MNVVYLVTEMDYEKPSYEIIAVFFSREKADKWLDDYEENLEPFEKESKSFTVTTYSEETERRQEELGMQFPGERIA